MAGPSVLDRVVINSRSSPWTPLQRSGGAEDEFVPDDGDAGDTENAEAAATSSLAAKGRQTTYWDLHDLV